MFEELLKQWANEQGFQTWSQDHAAVLRNLVSWLNSHAVEQPLAPDGAVCPAHQTYFEEDGTCAIAGCKETRPAGKANRSAASWQSEGKAK